MSARAGRRRRRSCAWVPHWCRSRTRSLGEPRRRRAPRLVRAVGAIAAKGEDAAAVAWLLRELDSGEGRAARYAANALGQAPWASARRGGCARRGVGPREVGRAASRNRRRLGKVRGRATPRARSPRTSRRIRAGAEDRARTASGRPQRAAGEPSENRRQRRPASPDRVVFRCRAGLESILAASSGTHGRAPERRGACPRRPSWPARPRARAAVRALVRSRHSGARRHRRRRHRRGDRRRRVAARAPRVHQRPVRFRLAFENGGHRGRSCSRWPGCPRPRSRARERPYG